MQIGTPRIKVISQLTNHLDLQFQRRKMMNMFVNDLILNACVETTEMFICEKILTTTGNKIYLQYTNGDNILSVEI
jgi:hypothetical protein